LIGFTLVLAGAFTVVDAAIWMLTQEGAFQFLVR
jgi:hypothetical protein